MAIKKVGEKKYNVDFHPGRGKKRVRRTVNGTRKTAEAVLEELKQRALRGVFGWPTTSPMSIKDLAELVVQDYKDNSRKSQHSAHQLYKIWVNEIGNHLAEEVSSDTLKELGRKWMESGLTPGRVNRRMSFIIRGYSIAMCSDQPKISKRPKWKKLKEAAPRSGFFEWEDFEKVREELPLHARPPVSIEYWAAMRSGEVHGLQWTQVRFEHDTGDVLIQLSDSKADEPRLVSMGGDLYDVLKRWREYTLKRYPDCPWVCHYRGKKLGSIKTAWKRACVTVGLGQWTQEGEHPGQRRYRGPIVHDFRRTGVRNLIRSGVPEKTAMAISGHKTRAIIDRYNIINEEDLIDAGRAVVDRHERRHGKSKKGGQSVATPTSRPRTTPLQPCNSEQRPADS